MSAPAGFFSVPARFNGRVLCRTNAHGSIWAWRAPSASHRPSPACLFLPAHNQAQAQRWARAAAACGWPAVIRPGSGFAVWQNGPLASCTPPLGVKVRLPPGISASSARALLRSQLGLAS